MNKTELHKLQDYLRSTLGNQALRVSPDRKDADAAEVTLGERAIAKVLVDDEDGDRSFSFEMKVPVARPAIEEYLRLLFDNPKYKVVPRARKTDSVELNLGSEFLGVISADDPKGKSFTFQMAILDYDLDEL